MALFVLLLKSLFKKEIRGRNNRFFSSSLCSISIREYRKTREFMKLAIQAAAAVGVSRSESKKCTVTLSQALNQRDEQYVLLSQNNFLFILCRPPLLTQLEDGCERESHLLFEALAKRGWNSP